MIKDVPSEYEYRQLVENIKETEETEYLSYTTLFLNTIEYIVGFLKLKQRYYQDQLKIRKEKQEQEKYKRSLSKRLPEMVSEWTK